MPSQIPDSPARPHPEKTFWRRLRAWVLWGAIGGFCAFAGFTLVLRYLIWPELPRYTSEIEAKASQALGLPVTIGRLEARWSGWRPALTLENLRLEAPRDRAIQDDNAGLSLERVEAVLSWRSLFSFWRGEPVFSLLVLERPALRIQRAADGTIRVAGIVTASGDGNDRGLDWLLMQRRIRIRDARIVWEDQQRSAPELTLEHVHLEFVNQGARHRFGLSARPPQSGAEQLELRGDLVGTAADAPADWRGKLYGHLARVDLAFWRAWVDYPLELAQGYGSLRFWLDKPDRAWKWRSTADLALSDTRLRLRPELPELALRQLSGRIAFSHAPGQLKLSTRKLALTPRNGAALAPINLALDWQGKEGESALEGGGKFSANTLDLDALTRLAASLPLTTELRQGLQEYAPRGQVNDVKLRWHRENGARRYQFAANFSGLGVKAVGAYPGMRNFSGAVEATERGGNLTLESGKASLFLPQVFAEAEIPLEKLDARIDWKFSTRVTTGANATKTLTKTTAAPEETSVTFRRLTFRSPHADGKFSGTWQARAGSPGHVDLEGNLTRAQATAVWRYLPKRGIHAAVPAWLKAALLAGNADAVSLRLKGDLAHFPFRDPRQGIFRITAKAHDVTLRYAPGWPEISGIEAELAFGAGMEIRATQGMISGTHLGKTTASLPDFAVHAPTLKITGETRGETAHFLEFIRHSPVASHIDHLTDTLRTQGSGQLELNLEIPLKQPDATQTQGRYTLANNQVHFLPGLPAAEAVRGEIAFTRTGLTIPALSGQFLGMPMRLSGSTEQGTTRLKAEGGLTAEAARRAFQQSAPPALLAALSGRSTWQADIAFGAHPEFSLTSSLQGLALALPEPFAKRADEILSLQLRKNPLPSEGRARRERLALTLGDRLQGEAQMRSEGATTTLERGSFGIGEAPRPLPERGILLSLRAPRLDVDAWRRIFSASSQTGQMPALPLTRLLLDTETLTVFGRNFSDVTLNLTPRVMTENKAPSNWRALIAAKEALGELNWDDSGKGRLIADLKRLHLPAENSRAGTSAPAAATPALTEESLPALSVRVEDFRVGTRALGRLEVEAENLAGNLPGSNMERWRLRRIALENPDARLSGDGMWNSDRRSGSSHTQLTFTLEAQNAGKLLGRLGYADMLKDGKAKLSGTLDWSGSPVHFDVPSLTGTLTVSAEKGTFSQMEPGVGKLLGLLSLSSLNRRLSLDFRDVLGQGLAFDSIKADLTIANGLLKTQKELILLGSIGEVRMRGEANMRTETQNLDVTVTPEIGGAASVGVAFAINPAAGAATLLAQKLLKDPLSKAFRLHYHITGSWNAPIVEKTGAQNAP
ncbi:MAG: TIGR02099 family protein [Zoogloeaceae bacterium]|jgi:uncharacterized protein (TIGR02099 family)|nr:TIGR02099 family protein [Zoogloeaceae bacterium]